mgnify:CR=1 FL=1
MSEPAKILAVDDEPDFELLIKQRFRQRIRKGDLAFRFARHGEEALAVLAEEPDIGLLLLDINMPEMDGWELMERLRDLDPALPVIIMSGYVDPERVREHQPAAVVASHLNDVVRRHADELLTRDATKHLVDELHRTSPAVVDELIPNILRLGEVQQVLQLHNKV